MSKRNITLPPSVGTAEDLMSMSMLSLIPDYFSEEDFDNIEILIIFGWEGGTTVDDTLLRKCVMV